MILFLLPAALLLSASLGSHTSTTVTRMSILQVTLYILTVISTEVDRFCCMNVENPEYFQNLMDDWLKTRSEGLSLKLYVIRISDF